MGFGETGERLWKEMSISERVSFLKALARAIHRQPTCWGGLTPEAVARIPSFDDLPSDLYGRLIMAMTEQGFSIEKQAETQKIMDDMARPTNK